MALVGNNYGLLKSQLLTAFSSDGSEVSLEELKSEYHDVINSTRRLSYIHDFAALISVLEKRGHVGEYCLAGLQELTKKLNNEQLNAQMSRYEENFRDPRQPYENSYALSLGSSTASGSDSFSSAHSMHSRSASGPSGSDFLRSSDRSEENSRRYDEAVELVCLGIGKQWMELARKLSVKEGEIDAIIIKHPNDLKARAREALDLFLRKTDPAKWQYNLLNGLVEARRRDLKEEVEELLLRNMY